MSQAWIWRRIGDFLLLILYLKYFSNFSVHFYNIIAVCIQYLWKQLIASKKAYRKVNCINIFCQHCLYLPAKMTTAHVYSNIKNSNNKKYVCIKIQVDRIFLPNSSLAPPFKKLRWCQSFQHYQLHTGCPWKNEKSNSFVRHNFLTR